MRAKIFDIDGTLADVTMIGHMLDGVTVGSMPPDFYNEYHNKAIDAPPVDWVVDAARMAITEGYIVILITARKVMYSAQTTVFLGKNNIPYHHLCMRSNDDDRPDHEYKEEVLHRLIAMGYDIEEAYDDNPAIIKLWQKHGIKTVYVQGFGFYYSLEDVSNEGNS